jgi:hypothetical protein
MKNLIYLLTFLLMSASFLSIKAQNMNNERLETILNVVSDSIVGQKGAWQFKINERMFMCVTDESHNRMRIMSPITKQEALNNEDLLKTLAANFHTALDVKYALSDQILWSVFIHPLKELTDKQVKNAVSQVYMAAITYGTTYSSTDLVFPGAIKEEVLDEEIIKEKVIDKKFLRKN